MSEVTPPFVFISNSLFLCVCVFVFSIFYLSHLFSFCVCLGFLFYQGETDAVLSQDAAAYEDKLTSLARAVRHTWPDVIMVVVLIEGSLRRIPHRDTVRAAQTQVCKAMHVPTCDARGYDLQEVRTIVLVLFVFVSLSRDLLLFLSFFSSLCLSLFFFFTRFYLMFHARMDFTSRQQHSMRSGVLSLAWFMRSAAKIRVT